jgi:hypothetical protein
MPSSLRLLFLVSFPFLLSACGGSSPEQSKEKEKPPGNSEERPAKEADPAAIAKLVKQLSSTDFTEREAASKALKAIGFPALDALRQAAKSNDAEVAQRASRLVEVIENSFEQLLADYRGYGLPLPPEDAKLVKFESGGRYILNDKLMPPTYFLGFLLKSGDKDKPARLLVGTQEFDLESHKTVEVVEPKADLVKGIDPRWWGRSTFELNSGLAIALQCKSRGWNDLARELWTVSLKQYTGHRFGGFNQPANLPYRTAVAYLAWGQYGNELVKPDTDRAKIAKQIRSLFAAEPSLNTEGNQALLKSLEAALVPSTAKPGSVEKMIDDLTDMCNSSHPFVRKGEPDPRYTRLAHMGFAAVPALIERLDDDRLTRSVKQGFNNFPTWIVRVKHVVSDLLQDLAGEEVGKDWLRRQQGYAVEKADAQEWWDRVRKDGEEAYLLANVLPNGEKAEWPNSLMLSIITEKYPKYLPKLYKTILDERPQMQSWPLAKAVAKSSLPDETKLELFLHASRNKNLEHRRCGLTQLQNHDPQEFMKILLATLESLPKTPTEPYWKCPEAAYAHLVMATDDPKAWEMLEKVAKRSDAGLRMAFMNPMNYSYVEGRQREQRLRFLAAFLDDADAPDFKANLRHRQRPLHPRSPRRAAAGSARYRQEPSRASHRLSGAEGRLRRPVPVDLRRGP